MQWTVLVEAEAPAAGQQGGTDLTPQQTATFSAVLAVHGGAACGDERHWSARVVVTEDEPLSPVHTADQAASYGQKLVMDAVGQVGLPHWPVVRVEVVPGLLGAQEAAAALGVSRQRFHQLRQSDAFRYQPRSWGTARCGHGRRWKASRRAGSGGPGHARGRPSPTRPRAGPRIS